MFTLSLFICALNTKEYDQILFASVVHFMTFIIFHWYLWATYLLIQTHLPENLRPGWLAELSIQKDLNCTITTNKPAVHTNNSLFSPFHMFA